jgi:hypothetical protein
MATKNKIVYGAGKRPSANHQLSNFLREIQAEVKVAAYLESSGSVPEIEWTLDAIDYNSELQKQLYLDIKDYNPDLIISDGELYVSEIASLLNIKLFYCSSLHLYDKAKKEFSFFGRDTLKSLDKFLRKFPRADKTFVYTPFCDIQMRPELENAEFITPYENSSGCDILVDNLERKKIITEMLCHVKNRNYIISDAATHNISSAFYEQKPLVVVPSAKDPEAILNANWITHYQLGLNLFQIELTEKMGIEQLKDANESVKIKSNYLSIQDRPYLHEIIEETWKQL